MNGEAYCYATGNSMAPVYGDGSLLKLVFVEDAETIEPFTPVYYRGNYGYNRHMYCGMVDLTLVEGDYPYRYAVIAHGDGSLDQIIPPDHIIATVEVVKNTLLPDEEGGDDAPAL